MAMVVELPPEVASALNEQARRAGVGAAEYARELIIRALPQGVSPPSNGPPANGPPDGSTDDATLKLLADWAREDRTDDPDELARREREFELFKQGMNRNRRDAEGATARTPFP